MFESRPIPVPVPIHSERRAVNLGALSTCLLLLVLGLAASWVIHALRVTDDLETHANAVLSAVEHLLEHTTAAESRQRRYVLSHDPADREGMRDEVGQAEAALHTLDALTTTNGHQHALVQDLSGLFATRIGYLEHGVSLVQQQLQRQPPPTHELPSSQPPPLQGTLPPPPPPLADPHADPMTPWLGTGRGTKAMALVVAQCRQIEEIEQDLLTLRHSQMTRLETTAVLTIIVLVSAGIIANLVARAIIQRTLRRRQILENRLSESNRHLERQVAERTRELSEQARRLEEANVELESFSYSVSHDLRAPLRAIDGYSQILVRSLPNLDPESARRLGHIRESAGRMNQLITDLLAFSKVGRTELARSTIDMSALVQEAWEELAPTRAHRSITFACDPALPPCQADPALIKQVLLNLLSNAIKYTARSAETTISVRWSTTAIPPGQVLPQPAYCIADNGAGFDMRLYDRLFAVFQRLHETSDFEGTGVGLATVKRIIERHGGVIWATGVVGSGANFYVSLPSAG